MERVGIGQDSHKFGGNKPLVLGGVVVSKTGGLSGKSDADVILHSLCNAISSAVGGNSLSTWADVMLARGISDSKMYLKYVFNKARAQKYKVKNVSICVEAKKPQVTLDAVSSMKENIASLLEINEGEVGITFTSGEGLTPFGKGLGIAATTIVLLVNA